jgi:hypothetical protein
MEIIINPVELKLSSYSLFLLKGEMIISPLG